jgi:hypothetical protein
MYSKSSFMFLLVLLIPLGLSTIPTARADAMAHSPPLETLELLRERLALTDAQLVEVEPVLRQHHVAQQAVFDLHDINPRAGLAAPRPSRSELFALASALRPVWEQADSAMAEILTDEQLREWRLFQNERRNQLQRRLRGRR